MYIFNIKAIKNIIKHMKYIVVLFFIVSHFFELDALGALKKVEQTQTIQNDFHIPYDSRGSLDIISILNLKEGSKICFTINSDKKIQGVVSKVINKDESITIVGDFSREEKSGFVFFANSKNTVGGILFFPKEQISYKLKYDEKNNFFYLEPEKIVLQN